MQSFVGRYSSICKRLLVTTVIIIIIIIILPTIILILTMTLLITDLSPVLHCGLKEPNKIYKRKKKSLSQIKFKEE